MQIVFDFAHRKKKLKDLNTVQMMKNGNTDTLRITEMMARYLVNEAGEYLPFDKSMQILEDLEEDQIKEVIERFALAVQETAVPKANGNLSNSPSEVTSEVSESPAG